MIEKDSMGRHTQENSMVETYQMLVHIFGATDSPCCANFAIKTVARDNSENYSIRTIETVLRSFYVDDLLKLATSEQKAVSFIKELVPLMKARSFRWTKLISINKNVMKENYWTIQPTHCKMQTLIMTSKKEHLE